MIKYDLKNWKNRIFFGCSTDVSEEIIGCIAVKKWEIFGFFTNKCVRVRQKVHYISTSLTRISLPSVLRLQTLKFFEVPDAIYKKEFSILLMSLYTGKMTEFSHVPRPTIQESQVPRPIIYGKETEFFKCPYYVGQWAQNSSKSKSLYTGQSLDSRPFAQDQFTLLSKTLTDLYILYLR